MGNGNVVVAVQPSPGDDLVELDVIEPDTNHTDAWSHYTVPLADYSGRIVRIVVFTDVEGYRDVIIGGMKVTDGDSDLPNDRFPTGRAWEDGWRCDRFVPFFMSMVRELEYWEALVEARGDIIIRESLLTAPDGLERWEHMYSSSKYDLERYDDTDRMSGFSWSRTSAGGHIEIVGARFVADTSTIMYVPIIVQDGEVDIRGSHLEGDGDLLAIDRSFGDIVGTEFVTRAFVVKQPYRINDEPRVLGTSIRISFNTSKGPLTIEDCIIDGPYQALDLNRAWVELRGCDIDNVRWISIWDHDSEGLGTWAQISAANDVRDTGIYRYFKTHTAIFEMVGLGRPQEGSVYGGFTGVIEWEGMHDDRYNLNNRIISVDPFRIYILMPTFTVDHEDVELSVEEVMVHAWTNWGGAKYVPISTDLRSGTIRMDPLLKGSHNYWDEDTGYKFVQSYGGGPGRATIGMDVDVPHNYTDEYWLVLYVDGEVETILHGRDANDSRWSNYECAFNHTFSIPSGVHALGIELMGIAYGEQEPTQLLNDTRWYYRVSDAGSVVDALDFIQEGKGTVMLDPGLELELERYSPEPSLDDQYHIELLLSEGSSFIMLGEDVPSPNRVAIQASGPGDMTLYDIDVGSLSVTLADVDLDCLEVSCTMGRFTMDGGVHRFMGYEGRNETVLQILHVEDFLMVDSVVSISARWYNTYMSVVDSHARLSNITFGDNGGEGLYASVRGHTTLDISNSTFVGSGLILYPDYMGGSNATVFVSYCVFEGDGAYLWVQDQMYSWTGIPSFLPGSRIQRNRLVGEGAKLVCQRQLMDWILDDNTLKEGAAFYVMYELNFRWAEDANRSGNYYSHLLVDVEIIEISEEVLGHEWERWDSIFVEGTLDPPTVVDPEPVPFIIKGEYYISGFSSMRWTMGFQEIDPTDVAIVVDIPEWEDIIDLIQSQYGNDGTLEN
ncbi:MAG: hypothetical protein GQ558_03920 [Thermoplasmata archaeon]|nr:hypothetical protein [Thermoplasmata archaeon]